ncbi:hypothetical protein V12G01_10326 [Vibrio alginolyticus 12G01]|uniref:hypothetical protein n=1 Tax=Vibrio alginolyticus TaxID=663 RepID=UPI0000D536E7|nr:hypothetical protein [Vibrio alginolyticus]EAS75547.1 hypothetical protein V12G01_10326 [Vibrio alginolyticus 12G01]
MKKTKFVEIPDLILEQLKSTLDKEYDSLAIEYLEFIEKLGRQTVLSTELPEGIKIERVRLVLRPFLQAYRLKLGYRSTAQKTVLWGVLKKY